MANGQNASHETVLRIWADFFRVFFGWPRGRVEKWAARYKARISDPQSLFFHETEIYYVAPLLIPPQLRKRLTGLDGISFAAEIERQILLDQKRTGRSLLEDYDWQSAKRRVEDLLNQYGETLANIEDPLTRTA